MPLGPFAKNVNTVWREAEKLLGNDTAPLQMVNPLLVIETVMHYFFILWQTGREANAPLDEVRNRREVHQGHLAQPR